MTSKQSKKPIVIKTETLEEYLARGGKIQKIPEHIPEEPTAKVTVKSTSNEPPKPMCMLEGALLWGEKIVRKKKDNRYTGDLDCVPQSLIDFLKQRGEL